MASVLRWVVGVGIIWFVVALALTACLAWLGASPEVTSGQRVLQSVLSEVLDWGASLGRFIAPIVQIALVVMILIIAAERFGFTAEKRLWSGFAAMGSSNNVQAFIAITIIGGLVIGIIGGLVTGDGVKDLKDLALVVVGFYFGTRRGQGEVEAGKPVAGGNEPTTIPDQQNPPLPA
jgi:hypothetical protein